MKTLATDKSIYKKLKNNPDTSLITRVYKQLAKPTPTSKPHRMCKFAIAQLVQQGRYAINYDAAITYSFRQTPKALKLTKAERKVAKEAYNISQSDLSHQIISTLLFNDKAHQSLKLISQIKQYIDDQNTATDQIASALNITLASPKNTEAKNKKTTPKNTDTTETDKPEPLKLVNTN